MSAVEPHVFGAALTSVARNAGFENARELMRYSGYVSRNTWNSHRPAHDKFDMIDGVYPLYEYLLYELLDSHKAPLTFTYKDHLFAAVQTYGPPGDKVLEAAENLTTFTKGRLSWGLEPVTSKRRVVSAFFKALNSEKRRSQIFWIEVGKPSVISTKVLTHVLTAKSLPDQEHGGFVEDLQWVIERHDVPKNRLWRLNEEEKANTTGLRSVFPEMVASYQNRGVLQWRFLWNIIPGEISFLRSFCLAYRTNCDKEPLCSEAPANVLDRHYSDYLTETFPEDANCGATERINHPFIYFHEDNVWVPEELSREYRLYRLWQRRLCRLLRHHFYKPGGLVYRIIARRTMVGKIV